jgi:hypothetical protein
VALVIASLDCSVLCEQTQAVLVSIAGSVDFFGSATLSDQA